MKYKPPEIIDIYSFVKKGKAGAPCTPGCNPSATSCGDGNCPTQTDSYCRSMGVCVTGGEPSHCCGTGLTPPLWCPSPD